MFNVRVVRQRKRLSRKAAESLILRGTQSPVDMALSNAL